MRMCLTLVVLLLVAIANSDAISTTTADELSLASPPIDQDIKMSIDGHRMLRSADETVGITGEERGIVASFMSWIKRIKNWLLATGLFDGLIRHFARAKMREEINKVQIRIRQGNDASDFVWDGISRDVFKSALGLDPEFPIKSPLSETESKIMLQQYDEHTKYYNFK